MYYLVSLPIPMPRVQYHNTSHHPCYRPIIPFVPPYCQACTTGSKSVRESVSNHSLHRGPTGNRDYTPPEERTYVCSTTRTFPRMIQATHTSGFLVQIEANSPGLLR